MRKSTLAQAYYSEYPRRWRTAATAAPGHGASPANPHGSNSSEYPAYLEVNGNRVPPMQASPIACKPVERPLDTPSSCSADVVQGRDLNVKLDRPSSRR